MKLSKIEFHFSRRYLLVVGLIAVALYVLLPQIDDFQSSWHLLRRPEPLWTVAAIALTALTYLAAAATYCLLAIKSLRYGQMVLIQLAAMFINRLLPGGIGALGVNYLYLRKNKHSAAQATGVVAVNDLMGVAGNTLLIAIALSLPGRHAPAVTWHGHYASQMAKLAIGLVLILVTLAMVLGRQRFRRKAIDIRGQMASYYHRPWRLPGALTSSMLLTSCNALCLLCCGVALGVHLPFTALLLVLTLGVGTGAIAPTPGGLGGFEAGLVGGLIAYHVASPAALAVALLYRLVSYWLPLLAGAPAFLVSQRRHLF